MFLELSGMKQLVDIEILKVAYSLKAHSTKESKNIGSRAR